MTNLEKLMAFQESQRGESMRRWDYIRKASDAIGLEVKKIAEIGVFKGLMSTNLRELFPDAELYLVDPWETYDDYHIKGAGNAYRHRGQDHYDEIFKKVCKPAHILPPRRPTAVS